MPIEPRASQPAVHLVTWVTGLPATESKGLLRNNFPVSKRPLGAKSATGPYKSASVVRERQQAISGLWKHQGVANELPCVPPLQTIGARDDKQLGRAERGRGSAG